MSTHRIIADPYLLIWSSPPIHLHYDGELLVILFLWTFIGTAVYLFSHGLAEGPKPGLTIFCGPSAWILSIYKYFMFRHIRNVSPPPVPKSWTIPRGWERG